MGSRKARRQNSRFFDDVKTGKALRNTDRITNVELTSQTHSRQINDLRDKVDQQEKHFEQQDKHIEKLENLVQYLIDDNLALRKSLGMSEDVSDVYAHARMKAMRSGK